MQKENFLVQIQKFDEGDNLTGKLTGIIGEKLILRCGGERRCVPASHDVCEQVREQHLVPSPVKLELEGTKAVRITPVTKKLF